MRVQIGPQSASNSRRQERTAQLRPQCKSRGCCPTFCPDGIAMDVQSPRNATVQPPRACRALRTTLGILPPNQIRTCGLLHRSGSDPLAVARLLLVIPVHTCCTWFRMNAAVFNAHPMFSPRGSLYACVSVYATAAIRTEPRRRLRAWRTRARAPPANGPVHARAPVGVAPRSTRAAGGTTTLKIATRGFDGNRNRHHG